MSGTKITAPAPLAQIKATRDVDALLAAHKAGTLTDWQLRNALIGLVTA